MRNSLALAASLCFVLGTPVAAAPAKPSPEVINAAQHTLMIIMSALKQDNIPKELKGGLFGCLYERSLGDISAATTKGFAANSKADPKDNTQYLLMVARACGIVINVTPSKPPVKPGN